MFKISLAQSFSPQRTSNREARDPFSFLVMEAIEKAEGGFGCQEQGHSGEMTLVLAGVSVGADEVRSWNRASCPCSTCRCRHMPP